jgi:putative IMPACT (imprinted ancient) family translation regulator
VSNDVAKILAIMPATLKVTDESNDIKVNYNNTQGLKVWLDQHDNANVLKSYTNVAFGIAYFDFTVTIE